MGEEVVAGAGGREGLGFGRLGIRTKWEFCIRVKL